MPEQTWSDEARERMEGWHDHLAVLVQAELKTHGPLEIEPEDVDAAVRNAVAKFFEEA